MATQKKRWQREIVTDQVKWDDIVGALPNAHVLQSWAWGDFKSRWSWQAERLLWRENDQPIAAAQILSRKIPQTPWRFLYISKGPVLDYDNQTYLETVLAELESYARQSKALFIKIDPDVARYFGAPDASPELEETGRVWLDCLEQRGWLFSPEQIQFRNTMILDLSPDLETLLAQMKSKWRYNIRLADRKGVVIRTGTVADLLDFYQMYTETAERDGFLIRPEAYYRDVWEHFINLDQAEILLATVDGEIVAGLILFFYGSTAWYLYGASTGQHRKLMPNHLLQWQAIQRSKARDCLRYDFWGASDEFAETDRMWGVYRFKQGFAPQVLQGLGAFDYPVNRPLYWAFVTALPHLRTLWRRVRS